ncbi:MAG: hypothetical protein DRH76_08800 [Deltaproteobacteria bacterium]|nr:MAG: hypothetical protein DRH76_08800 [Deltaproteobacteria bacterium]
MSENPLQQYFRTPSIHLDLPSKGEGYAPGMLDLPATGEVPVLPMTAIDEITYKTPDALFNGSAVVQVIESCIPAIKDAWQMPVTDVTAVLCAIRIASFGHEMDIETKCPKCGETANYSLDLRTVLDSIKATDYSKSFKAGDLAIMFKPMVYKDLNENEKLQFEEQRLAQLLTSSEMDQEDQIKLLSESFTKISNYTLSTIAKNIASITTPECTVTEEEFILEFLKKADGTLYKKIKNAVIEQKNKEALKPLKIKCNALVGAEVVDGVETGGEVCGHEYEQNFTLDMSSFFAQS